MDLYMMNCELLATCSALGYLEGDVYHKEPDCLESVKDLIRYLRYEDETRDVRQQLGAAQILQNDLLPLIAQYPQDKLLFDAIVRLMVNLTQPALLCFGKVPHDPGSRHCFLQVVSYLQAYKEAFASEKVFGVLSEKLYDLLQLDWEQRQEEDNLLVERILLLVRNVLHIPADPEEEKSVDDDASSHDRVLWAMHVSGMDDLLKFLASSSAEQQWGLHVLEIISLMFRDQDPEQLAATGQARPAKEQAADVRDLEVLRQRELAERKSRAFQRGSRHSRFGGSYVVQGLKSIGDRDLVFHKGLHNLKEHSHDLGKEPRRVPKRRQPAREAEPRRRSALNVRLFLREFCGDFLQSCYNPLMRLVKDQLLREKSQQHDETYYLWAMAFFMAFNRGRHFRAELVSETVSVRAFHFIEQNLTAYHEAMLLDKKEATSWARRMHLAVNAYRELLTTVQEMDRSPDEAVRDSSKVIKNNIFYLMEHRELFLALFRKFEESRQPRSFLRDLVETTHLFLRMLETFSRGRNNLVVQSKRVRRKKQPRAGRAALPAQPRAPQELEELWPSLAEQLGACAQGAEPLPEDVVPFDAASETPVEEQRAEAMVRIQDSLLGRRAPAALTLLRSAREVWPERDVFGSPQAGDVFGSLDEEIQLLRQILFAPLPRQAAPEVEEPGEEEEEEEEEVEEELASVQVSEKEFNFLDYLKRFASASVVKAYVLLLRGYRQNSAHTNHCVAKMLHRIAYDLKMEALLFQLSVFCIFNRLLSDPSAAAYKELVTFAKYVLGKFFALAATNKKVYVELLFWKSTATVREMTEGYGSLQEGEGRLEPQGPSRGGEGLRLQQHLTGSLLLPALVPGGPPSADVVSSILTHLRAPGRTRKQVVKQLVRLGLAESARDFPRERKGTRLVLWMEEQELELQRLFEEFQGADDILGNIMKHLTAKRSKARVVEKLLSLGLVAERKELYKKRKRKPGLPDMDSAEEESDSEEEEEAWEEGGAGDRAVEGHREQGSENQLAPEQDVQGLARRLRQGGLAGSLLWLQNCLNRAAEDREEDGTAQPVPLVPLLEENEDAMENQAFQKLLRKVGVRAPANEQESFWRIPAKLSPEQLRRAAASVAQEEPEGEEGSPGGPAAGPEQRAQALQTLRLARRTRGAPAVPEEETPGPEQPPASPGSDLERDPPVQAQLGPKRSRVIHSDDDEDPESRAEVPARPDPTSAGEGTRPPRRRKRLRLEEEEED
ncbi:t-SNARE domain-containing protein 1 [Platysternon megacephalum]|uniref:t-SNARE domain-containing protein 1 n=1 Tax=Platysternon megacephalum TaxID=55544 RepID=A0A4D9E0V8_9SAUR|nr:t-SNARE domain-containing protein 1 [Platysternon megacephalum]